jgi:ATP-dependent DNA ligase
MQAIIDLESTSKKTEKMEILVREKNNEILKQFFRLSLDPYIVFYIRTVRQHTVDVPSSISEVMDFLENTIATRKLTGHAAMEAISARMVTLSSIEKSMVERILKKSPDCGVSDKTVNKVWSNLIPIYPVLLAEPYEEKLGKKLNWKNGVFIQTKSDGARANIIVDGDGNVTVRSRQGNLIETHQNFSFLSEHRGCVFDGELVTIDPTTKKIDVRQTGNGIINKAIRGTISEEESSRLHMVVWDTIPFKNFVSVECDIPYSVRFEKLQELELSKQEKISIIWSKTIHSLEEAQSILAEHLERGEEGVMLKDKDLIWEDKRSKKQLKLKLEVENDFEVTGWTAGEGFLSGNMGSLVCSSSEGKVTVNVSGFSLILRSQIFANITGNPVQYSVTDNNITTTHTVFPGESEINISSIINVTHGGCVTNKQGGYSVFLPRFNRECPDKTTADSFERISANMIG